MLEVLGPSTSVKLRALTSGVGGEWGEGRGEEGGDQVFLERGERRDWTGLPGERGEEIRGDQSFRGWGERWEGWGGWLLAVERGDIWISGLDGDLLRPSSSSLSSESEDDDSWSSVHRVGLVFGEVGLEETMTVAVSAFGAAGASAEGRLQALADCDDRGELCNWALDFCCDERSDELE